MQWRKNKYEYIKNTKLILYNAKLVLYYQYKYMKVKI